jgi:hypothetical protein
MLILNVDFAGSVQIDANDITFQYTGEDENKKNIITGVEWNELSEDEKEEYIVESMVKVIENNLDVSYEEITVSAQKDLFDEDLFDEV